MQDVFPVRIRFVNVITAVCANLPNPLFVVAAVRVEAEPDAAVVAVAVVRRGGGHVIVRTSARAVAGRVGRLGSGLPTVPVEPVLEQRGHVHVDAAIICGGGSGQFRARGLASSNLDKELK